VNWQLRKSQPEQTIVRLLGEAFYSGAIYRGRPLAEITESVESLHIQRDAGFTEDNHRWNPNTDDYRLAAYEWALTRYQEEHRDC